MLNKHTCDESVLKRFESKVIKTDNCWIWAGGVGNGYGYLWVDGKVERAHRVSYVLFKGEIPPKLNVCHKCDNPICVNPEHFFLGTQSDNLRDCARKGRTSLQRYLEKRHYGDKNWMRLNPEKVPKGEKHPQAKLNKFQVLEIRKMYKEGKKIKDIAIKYGVCPQQIGKIVRYKKWKHVVQGDRREGRWDMKIHLKLWNLWKNG